MGAITIINLANVLKGFDLTEKKIDISRFSSNFSGFT